MTADRVLQQNALKRSNYPHAAPPSKVIVFFQTVMIPVSVKKNLILNIKILKKVRPQPKDEPAQKMIQMLIRTVQQAGMRGSVKSLGGRHNCIIVIVNRVMSVYIVMRDLSVERVFARGYDEDDPTDGKSFSNS